MIAQAGDPIISVTPQGDGYLFKFKNNGEVNVKNQTDGVSVGYEDGEFFWTLGGEPLKDASGKNAVITVSPDFRISGGLLEISTDGKKSWKALDADASDVIKSVKDNPSDIAVTFLGGTEVVFPKEAVMQVALSGDGSTMATNGKATVDFLLSGKTDSFTVTPLLPEGWNADVVWETSNKGKVVFTAPAASAAQTARLFFCDGIGNMIASDIDFDALTVDESFPVMYPAWEAYSISAEGGNIDVVLVNNLDEYDTTLEPGVSWLSEARTKAVREDVITLIAEPNDNKQMRSATVTFTAGAYVKTVVVWQEGKLTPTGSDLSANGTANCYIVSQEGDYCFNATIMGCGNDGIIEGAEFHATEATLAPESAAILFNDNDVISDVAFDKETGIISFHATGNKGNAGITVKNARNIVIWSWHIWCTDIPKERTHTNPDYLQFTVMDRNLGATSANPADGDATCGLYYQWGRKDPYTALGATSNMTVNTAHAFAFAIRYPQRAYTSDGNSDGNWYSGLDNYLWGNPDYGKSHYLKDLEKTIYDPCPIGYMVPPANTFLIFKDESRSQFTEEGIIVHGDYGQINFFPWAGRMYKNMNTKGAEVALWHSSAARYNSKEDAGGAQTRVEKETGKMYWYEGDIRARALPIRCVKQVTD